MAKLLIQLTVFASGTSETQSERSALRRVVEELNKQLEKTHGITVRVRAWPDDIRPGVNAYSQAELNRQMGDEYDIYLGILGSRFGTPTQRAGSGTEEEFGIALKSFQDNSQSVRLLFYFKRAVEDPFSIDLEQLQRVKQFRERLAIVGVLYRDFHDTSDFVQQTREHLYSLIIDEWKDGSWIPVEGFGPPSSPPNRRLDADRLSPVGDNPPQLPEKAPSPEAMERDKSEEAEFGYLEYVQTFHQSVQALLDTIGKLAEHTTQMNDGIRARTAESEALQNEQAQMKAVRGSREQQQFVSRAKAIVDDAAQDLDEYTDALTDTLAQYGKHGRAMLGSLRAAFESAGNMWDESAKKENSEALTGLVSVMDDTLQRVAAFQITLRGLPALTGKFKRARNRAATKLGEFIAEVTFSGEEAKRLAADLSIGETGET